MFSIYDITDHSHPVLKATQSTPGNFNHNTWLSNDGKTIFTVDEIGNTPLAAYDISDFSNITLLDTFYNGNFPTQEVHNVRVLGDFLVNPSYGSHLTLVDASRPANMIEVGSYVTGGFLYWDADPFTRSGVIIATETSTGRMLLFDPTYQHGCYLEGVVTDSITGITLNNVSIEILTTGITKLSDGSGQYKTGYADPGTFDVVFSKPGYVSKQVSVSLSNGVLTQLDVELYMIGSDVQEILQDKINVYPNPANNFVNVEANGLTLSSWNIYDELGRTILKSNSQSNLSDKFQIELNSLPVGIYNLKLETRAGEVINKSLVRN
jgi:hypothetical protein